MKPFWPIWMPNCPTYECVPFGPTSRFVGNVVPHWRNWSLRQWPFRAALLRNRRMKLIDLFRLGRNSCDGGLILKAGKGFSPDASRLNWIDMSRALFLHRARLAARVRGLRQRQTALGAQQSSESAGQMNFASTPLGKRDRRFHSEEYALRTT